MRKLFLLVVVTSLLSSVNALNLEIGGKTCRNVFFKKASNPMYTKLFYDGGLKLIALKDLPAITLKTKDGETLKNVKINSLSKKGIDISVDGKLKYIKFSKLIPAHKAYFKKKKKKVAKKKADDVEAIAVDEKTEDKTGAKNEKAIAKTSEAAKKAPKGNLKNKRLPSHLQRKMMEQQNRQHQQMVKQQSGQQFQMNADETARNQLLNSISGSLPSSAKFTIEPSNYLNYMTTKSAGDSTIYAYIGKRTAKGTACTFVISESDLTQKVKKYGKPTLKQVMDLTANESKKTCQNLKYEKAKKIKINGTKFIRSKWSGKMNGVAVEGYWYCACKGNHYFTIIMQDVMPDSKKTLVQCKKIMKTFKIK